MTSCSFNFHFSMNLQLEPFVLNFLATTPDFRLPEVASYRVFCLRAADRFDAVRAADAAAEARLAASLPARQAAASSSRGSSSKQKPPNGSSSSSSSSSSSRKSSGGGGSSKSNPLRDAYYAEVEAAALAKDAAVAASARRAAAEASAPAVAELEAYQLRLPCVVAVEAADGLVVAPRLLVTPDQVGG